MIADFLTRVAPLREIAQSHLGHNLASSVSLVNEVGEYILMSGGKRLRPILFLLAARMVDPERTDLDRFSSIFEFLHCASLLHDDVIDEADTRRAVTTANRKWDNPTAILVGDHLFARGLVLTAETGIPAAVTVISECIARLAEGQVLELVHQFDLETDYDTYLEIITAKTAVLLSAATQIGGILAGADKAREKALVDYGTKLGVAFQMIDDLLDYAGDEALVGKPLGQDLKEGKATLPWIRALVKADPVTRAELLRRGGRMAEDESHWAWIKATVTDLGGLDECLAQAEQLKDEAKASLELFAPGEARDILADLADYVCRRRL